MRIVNVAGARPNFVRIAPLVREKTAEVMRRLEPVLLSTRPDLVFVVGDVNSTLAAALTAVKLGIPAAHVEAGLHRFDQLYAVPGCGMGTPQAGSSRSLSSVARGA